MNEKIIDGMKIYHLDLKTDKSLTFGGQTISENSTVRKNPPLIKTPSQKGGQMISAN